MIPSAFSLVSFTGWGMKFRFGLIALSFSAALMSLCLPTSPVKWMICRCRLLKSTVSNSTMPMVPTPAAVRYNAIGEPSPPEPISNTFAALSRSWPSTPTSGRIRWREYRLISSLVNFARSLMMGSRLGGVPAVTALAAEPPAIDGTMEISSPSFTGALSPCERMSSSLTYTRTKLRSLPSSPYKCGRSLACSVVRLPNTSLIVVPRTSTVACPLAKPRNAVGIVTLIAIILSWVTVTREPQCIPLRGNFNRLLIERRSVKSLLKFPRNGIHWGSRVTVTQERMMAIKVTIPTALRGFANGQATVEVRGTTISEVLGNLTTEHAKLRPHLYGEDGKLRNFVRVYVNDEDIRSHGDNAPVNEGDEISIVPSIAGGSA